MTGLALYFLQPTGWTLYVPVTGVLASKLSPMPCQEMWSSVVEKVHSFWSLAIAPTLSCGQERHLDAELPTDATELESNNRRCSSLCEYPKDEDAPSTHFVKVRGDNARLNGRTRYWYALPPKGNLRNFLWHGRMDMWKYASLRSIVKNQSSDLICGTIWLKLTFWTWAAWRSHKI